MTKHIAKQDIEEAKVMYEKLARRLDDLWSKERLTADEQREVELILNNAAIISEMLEGKTPAEFREGPEGLKK